MCPKIDTHLGLSQQETMLSSEEWLSLGNEILTLRNDCMYVYLLLESRYGKSHSSVKHMQRLVEIELSRLQSDLDSRVNAQFPPPQGTYPSSMDLLPGTDVRLTKVFYGRVPYTHPTTEHSTRPLPKYLTEDQIDFVYQTLSKTRTYLQRVHDHVPIPNKRSMERRLNMIGYLVQS